ncbi:MAG: threonylcarbamoyl-AMP synthase [Bacilli bacterium]|nr:threonylcarbamoyl-AMP synthase [Bacilli bacterium]
MDTKLIKKALENHGVISFPTETVMGLGVFYDDFEAYNKLNKVKNRPEDKPYTLMLGDAKSIAKYAYIDERSQKIINAFMPGSITVLLKSKDNVPGYVTHNTGIIGVRVPALSDICEMINEVGKPLLVPSANKSGEKPAMNSDEVKAIFKDELDYIVEGKCVGGIPSTLVDLTKEDIKIIREGPISKSMILEVLGGNK